MRFAFRQLLKNPGFSIVAILTLALGIGANTAIFSIINAVLLRPPPFKEPDKLVSLTERSENFGEMSVAYPNFRDWSQQQDVFSSIAAYRGQAWNLAGDGYPERVDALQVSANFIPTLGVRPILGRVFTQQEDAPGGEKVAVLSEGLWRRRFGADSGIIGRSLNLDGAPYTVVGVMPASFSFPRRIQLWTPIGYQAAWTDNRGSHPGVTVLGRLKDGVTLAEAQAGMRAVAARLAKDFPDTNTGNTVTVVSLREQFVGRTVRAAMGVLLAATTFVLLIACANVANLLLARAAQRQREIAIRRALGASTGMIARQLLLESGFLGLAGGALGLGLAYSGLQLLVGLLPSFLLDFVTISIDQSVLLFTLACSLATGLLFGLAPVWSLVRDKCSEALKEGGRGEAVGMGRNWARRGLIVTEIALALVLLVSGGLLIRSFANLQAVPVGVDSRNVLVADLSLPATRYAQEERQLSFYREALERIGALPGVQSAGLITPLPFGFGGWQTRVRIEGEPAPQPGRERYTEMAIVSPDYFQTVGLQVLEGRSFNDADIGKPRICIIDESFAAKHFQGDALGKRMATGQGTNWMLIVGIVRHVKVMGAAQDARIQTYQPIGQNVPDGVSMVIRAGSEPLAFTKPVVETILKIDPDQPLANVRTLETVIAQTIAERRLAALLLTVFALVALSLALVGIYGVMSFTVANRTREIGIRMALGAKAADVLKLVLKQGGALILIGIVIGLIAGLGATRLLQNLLFGVGPTDLLTFAIVPILLCIVAILACALPARRASKVDPMIALRYE